MPLVIAGLVAAAALDPERLTDRALGAAVGYLSLRASRRSTELCAVARGWAAATPSCLAASGAWVGASALPQVILGAAVSALVAAACLRLAGVRLGARSALPFGPFLALATWLIWLLGPAFM